MRAQRLEFRAFGHGDAPRIAELAGDFDVARMTARIPYPYTLVAADQWIAGLDDTEFVRAVLHEGSVIGAVGIVLHDNRSGEIGYWIGKPYWGRGFATEAARALVTHAFGKLGLRRLTCGHFVDNPASARVIAKLGFARTGLDRMWCDARGAEVDVITYVRRRPVISLLGALAS
jgi:RimJ/RimL family protein N-acetyltransferase